MTPPARRSTRSTTRTDDGRRPRVGFLGPHGTFAEEALLGQADLAAGEAVPFRDVPHVITAVERGDVDLGIVPIENSIEGSVTVTLDTLAFDTELLVQREIDLPVSLHLCAPKVGSPGIPIAAYTVEDIKRAFYMPKPCASTCPIAYAHHVSRLDQWRSQKGEPLALPPPPTAIVPDGKRHLPVLAA